MDDRYRALGEHHHEKNTEVEPLENDSLLATIVVVFIFIACFVGALIAVGVIRP